MISLWRNAKQAFRSPARSLSVVVLLVLAMALAVSSLEARSAASSRISVLSKTTTGTTITVTSGTGFASSTNTTPLSETRVADVRKLPNVVAVSATLSEELTSTDTSLKAPKFTGRANTENGSSTSSSSQAFAVPLRVTGTQSPGTGVGVGVETLKSGAWFSAKATNDVAIVGATLANDNHLVVNSTFTAWGHTITVVGIYSTGSTVTDTGVLMPLATLQTLASAKGDVSNVVVTINSPSNAALATTAIEATVGSSATVTSSEVTLQAAIAPLNSGKSTATYLLLGAVLLSLIVLLVSALMFVGQLRDEIADRKAHGETSRSIQGQFISQTGVFAIVGTVVGFVVGALSASPLTSALFSGAASSPTAVFGGGFGGASRFTGGSGGGFGDTTRGTGGGFGGGAGSFGGATGGGFGRGGGTFTPGSGAGATRFGTLHSNFFAPHASLGVSTVLFAVLLGIVLTAIASLVATNAVSRVAAKPVLNVETAL